MFMKISDIELFAIISMKTKVLAYVLDLPTCLAIMCMKIKAVNRIGHCWIAPRAAMSVINRDAAVQAFPSACLAFC